MKWNGKWNGTQISVWNMEDARMEWNGKFQEWNGRQSSILLYHARFCALYLQKNTNRCRVVISNIFSSLYSNLVRFLGKKKVFAHRFGALTFCPSYKRGATPKLCILFYANYTILATQRGGRPWPNGPP